MPCMIYQDIAKTAEVREHPHRHQCGLCLCRRSDIFPIWRWLKRRKLPGKLDWAGRERT